MMMVVVVVAVMVVAMLWAYFHDDLGVGQKRKEPPALRRTPIKR